MIYLPSLRRLLLPALIALALIVFYKSSTRASAPFPALTLHRPDAPAPDMHIPISALKDHLLPILNKSATHLSPPKEFYYTPRKGTSAARENGSSLSTVWTQPALNPSLAALFKCPTKVNRYTKHIRLPRIIRNISVVPPGLERKETGLFFNPTILSLPYWSTNQYLIVYRIVTDGAYQQNFLCEANECSPPTDDGRAKSDSICSEDDLAVLGPAGGMRCATVPILLGVPPTPAEKCEGKMANFVDLPGSHDPRIFWSGRGEPLMVVMTHSRYACVGPWIIDLRALYPPLERLLASAPGNPSLGPLMSYPSLTELTRNPPATRSAMEKNWMLFFTDTQAYLHYDISPQHGRTFAKLLGGGLTTTNLTDPREHACLTHVPPSHSGPTTQLGEGTWHQASNSLRLILCDRADAGAARCQPGATTADNTVFFAVIHRKQSNPLGLPMRYERYLILWSAAPPFHLLAVSQHPLLLANETASGWPARENWDDNDDNDHPPPPLWAYFTYTVSIAYAWGRPGDESLWKNTGFLDDLVVLGLGLDDLDMGFATVSVRHLLQCLKACPGSTTDGD